MSKDNSLMFADYAELSVNPKCERQLRRPSAGVVTDHFYILTYSGRNQCSDKILRRVIKRREISVDIGNE